MKAGRWTPYLFLAPFVFVYITFTGYPLLDSILMSRQKFSGPQIHFPTGWNNYRLILSDPEFWLTLGTTARFAVGSLVIQLPVALGLALLLNHRDMPARAIWRLIFFCPVLIGGVFVGAAFQFIYGEQYGLLNGFLGWITGGRISGIHWLTDPHIVTYTLILTGVWMYAGYNMMFFLAGLQSIPPELYDAAQVDGAGRWRRFRHVTLPGLRGVGSFVVTTSLIGSFALFDLPRVMIDLLTPGRAGVTVMMYLYERGFLFGDLGYAAAMAWLLALMMLAMTIAQLRVMRGLRAR